MKKSNDYIDKKDLLNEVIKFKQNDNVASERLGMMLLEMHRRILMHKCFNGYHKDLKDEMMSVSLYRVLKGLHHFDPSKFNAFAYITSAIFRNYITVVMGYYKKRDKFQAYSKQYLEDNTLQQKMNGKYMFTFDDDINN